MRILHVTHELPPYELAGTAIYTHNIARAQAEHHDVFVFARLQDPELPPYQIHTESREGLTVRFMNLADLEWSPFENSFLDRRAEGLFRDFLEEVRPDVVHFQHLVGLGLGALEIAKALGFATVFTLHDFWAMCPMGQRMCYTDHTLCDPIDFGKCGPCVFGEGWKAGEAMPTGTSQTERQGGLLAGFRHRYQSRFQETPGRFARRPRALIRAAGSSLGAVLTRRSSSHSLPPVNPFERRFQRLREVLGRVDLLITPSAFLRDEFRLHFGIPSTRIIHSANGMDFGYVKVLPKTPSSRLRFGFLGSIIKTKGVHVLLEGFLEAASSAPDTELHVHGAPNRWSQDYLEDLEQRAKGHQAGSRVHFHGRFDNRKVGEVLATIDVLVLPSIWFENAPLTLNEAAMTRTPIVVSDRGGMLEFARDNGYGRTFPLGDSHALAAVMRELAGQPGLVRDLAGEPPPIKSVRDNALELVGIYARLRAGAYQAPSLEMQTRTRGGCLPLG